MPSIPSGSKLPETAGSTLDSKLDTSAYSVSKTRMFPGELGFTELMMWLSDSMNETDRQLREQMAALADRQMNNDKLSALINDLNFMEAECKRNGGAGAGEISDWSKQLGDAAYQTMKSSEAQDAWFRDLPPAAQAAFKTFLADKSDDGKVTIDKVKQLRDALKDAIQSNNSSNEMAMIKLQSAISARGQKIQIVSNIVNAMNEVASKTIGNIR